MKRLFTVLLGAILFCACQEVSLASHDYSRISKNPKINQALERLSEIRRNDVIGILNGANETKQPIRVMFRELEIYGLGNCEAVTMKTQSGGVVIFINKKHQNAPDEAIACLIAHESQHHALTGTIAEEVRAWITEVSTWNMFVRQNRNLASLNSPLVKRLNYINNLYANGAGTQRIENLIARQPIYANLN